MRRTRAQLRKGGEVGFGLSATEAGLLLASGCLVMLFVGRVGELKGSKAAVLRRLPDHRCRALPENSGYELASLIRTVGAVVAALSVLLIPVRPVADGAPAAPTPRRSGLSASAARCG